jgi:type II secretory pathway pseudopilin PulG
MTGWVIFGVFAAVVLIYVADRVVKARVQARRLRRMSERLAAAAARSEQQQANREAAAEASAALTSVLPAINYRPPVTLPGQVTRDEAPPH